MQNRKEQSHQTGITTFMKIQYPKVIFKVDAGADANKASFVARQVYAKQNYKRGHPDFQIIKRVNYNGFFLELKGCYDDLFNKNGTLKRGSDDHIVEQYNYIKELRAEGYYADFSWDLDYSIMLINWYLKSEEMEMRDYSFNSLTISERKAIEADEFFTNRGL